MGQGGMISIEAVSTGRQGFPDFQNILLDGSPSTLYLIDYPDKIIKY